MTVAHGALRQHTATEAETQCNGPRSRTPAEMASAGYVSMVHRVLPDVCPEGRWKEFRKGELPAVRVHEAVLFTAASPLPKLTLSRTYAHRSFMVNKFFTPVHVISFTDHHLASPPQSSIEPMLGAIYHRVMTSTSNRHPGATSMGVNNAPAAIQSPLEAYPAQGPGDTAALIELSKTLFRRGQFRAASAPLLPATCHVTHR